MAEKEYHVHAKNKKTGEEKIYTSVHNEDWKTRKGFDKNFLGIKVELPDINGYDKKESLAVVNPVSRNGKYALDYTHFSIFYDKDKKLPICTAVNIDGTSAIIGMEHEKRKGDKWYYDGRLKDADSYFQFGNMEYSGSDFDRGHMVRFYDPAWEKTDEANKIAVGDTFNYTNCCPQAGTFNGTDWNSLEEYYMARAIFKDDKICVFSGPILKGAKKINDLLVPLHFWKVIVCKKSDKIEAMGFLATHKVVVDRLEEKMVKPRIDETDIDKNFKKLKDWNWCVKISLIEEKTGLKFGLNEYDVFKDIKEEYHFEKLPNTEMLAKYEAFVADFEQKPLVVECLKNI